MAAIVPTTAPKRSAEEADLSSRKDPSKSRPGQRVHLVNERVTEQMLAALRALERLEHLGLKNCTLDPETVTAFVQLAENGLWRLKSFSLEDTCPTTQIATDIVIAVLSGARNTLVKLETNEEEINGAPIMKAAQQCPHLQELELYHGPVGISDESIRELATSCPELQTLVLTGDHIRMSDSTLEALATHCRIKTLDVASSEGCTVEGIGRFLERTYPNLRMFVLDTEENPAFEGSLPIWEQAFPGVQFQCNGDL
jgi:hypothetical protein